MPAIVTPPPPIQNKQYSFNHWQDNTVDNSSKQSVFLPPQKILIYICVQQVDISKSGRFLIYFLYTRGCCCCLCNLLWNRFLFLKQKTPPKANISNFLLWIYLLSSLKVMPFCNISSSVLDPLVLHKASFCLKVYASKMGSLMQLCRYNFSPILLHLRIWQVSRSPKEANKKK